MINVVQREAVVYNRRLVGLIENQQLPRDWMGPLDHVAWRAADAGEYDQIVESVRSIANKILEVKMNQRRIASAFLLGEIVVGDFGVANILEIIETKPDRAGKDSVGFQHAEFAAPSLGSVWLRVNSPARRRQNMPPLLERNPHHEWISLRMRGGQEVKFTNKSLLVMLEEQLVTGEAYQI